MEKQSVDFTLSPKNLTGIPFNKYQQDFTLIVNGEKYKTTRIVDSTNCNNYENDNYYFSNDEDNVFVLFDFKDKLIQLNNYSIRSHCDGKNCGHLRNWAVEASKDGEKWEEIDNRSDDSSLNEPNTTSTFNVKKGNNKFYRFIRLRQTGYSWYDYPNYNSYHQGFRFIELFGKLQEPQPK